MNVINGLEKRTQTYFYASVAVVLWSLGAYLLCLLSHLPFLQVMGIGLTVGGCVSLLLERRRCSIPTIKRYLTTRWIGIVLLLVNQLAYVAAFRLAPAAHVDLINYLWPSFLVVGEALRTRRLLSRGQVVGLLACFLALLVLVFPALNFKAGLGHGWGYLTAFVAALSWALYSLIVKAKSESVGEEPLVGVGVLIVGILCSVVQCSMGGFVSMTPLELFLILAFGAGVSGLAFPCWQRAIQLGSCAAVGGMANAIPILSVGWLIVGGVSQLSPSLVVSAFLVIVGCYLLGRSTGRNKTASTLVVEADQLVA